MADLATNAGEVAGVFHQVHHVRPAGVFHLIKTLHFVVVRDEAGEHHIATGHTVSNRRVGVGKAQRLRGEPVHVRRGTGKLAVKYANRVGAHVINRD